MATPPASEKLGTAARQIGVSVSAGKAANVPMHNFMRRSLTAISSSPPISLWFAKQQRILTVEHRPSRTSVEMTGNGPSWPRYSCLMHIQRSFHTLHLEATSRRWLQGQDCFRHDGSPWTSHRTALPPDPIRSMQRQLIKHQHGFHAIMGPFCDSPPE